MSESVAICTICENYFTRLQISKNLYKEPTLTLPLNLFLTEIVQNRTSEVVQIHTS